MKMWEKKIQFAFCAAGMEIRMDPLILLYILNILFMH
jgi:hypothetical protein